MTSRSAILTICLATEQPAAAISTSDTFRPPSASFHLQPRFQCAIGFRLLLVGFISVPVAAVASFSLIAFSYVLIFITQAGHSYASFWRGELNTVSLTSRHTALIEA